MSISRRSFLKCMTAAGVAVAVPKAGAAKKNFGGHPDSGGVLHDTTFCIGCRRCEAVCPEQAIDLTKFIEFKQYFRYLDRGTPEFPRRF